MTLKEIQAQYAAGTLSKAEYIHRMHSIHAVLFQYVTHLAGTEISRIEITDAGVIMTARATGAQFICDPEDERIAPIEILNFGAYEPADAAMMTSVLPKNALMLDVGANFGWYAINFAKTVPGLRVHAFEPLPRTYAYLQRNLTLNALTNVRAWPLGFGERAEEKTFYFYKEGSGNASMANLSERADVDQVTCQIARLDDFVAEQALKVDFIKCDVEGAELFVFKGAQETLRTQRPIVFTEMLRKWAARFDYHPNAIIELFADCGYHCFIASEGRLKRFGRMDEATVQTNFMFLHAEAHRDAIDRGQITL